MPAPRLLDKKTVNQELALDRKRQIDAGVKIAQKVDVVRGQLAEEEKNLEEFRTMAFANVQAEIAEKLAERDSLVETNARLWRERAELLAPLDVALRKEREQVDKDKLEVQSWHDRLTERSVEVLAKESEVIEKEQFLAKTETEIEARDELSVSSLKAAEMRLAEADDTLTKAQQEAERIRNDSQQRENHLRIREEDATAREIDLSKREKELSIQAADLESREKKLRSRQELFLKAQNYLKVKK